MSQYTTGELAKLCNVSVRTVQYYDTKDILKPTDLTEGGRRLYSDEDLDQLRLICLLKALGLSLDSIKGILESSEPEKILLLLLDEQEKAVSHDIDEMQKQIEAISIVRKSIQTTNTIPVQSISDIEQMMYSKKRLRRVYGIMIITAIIIDLIEFGTLALWIFKGIWQPFAIGIPVIVVMIVLLFRMYHKNTAYICPNCNTVFQPTAKAMFFARHTARTRKLTCPACQHNDFCVETAARD